MNGATPWRGHGGADDRDQHGEGRRRARAGGPARSGPAAARPGVDGSSWRPITTTIATTTGRGPQARRARHRQRATGTSPATSRLSERNRIQPNTTRWNVTAHRSHAGVLIRPPSACSATRPTPWKAPHAHERPRRPVPQPAEDHRDHQVAVREQPPAAAARRAGCRGSRAGSATASCASGARSRGSRSRGRGCGSSAGRRSPAAARARSRCPCSPRSRSRSAPCTRRRPAARPAPRTAAAPRTPGRRSSRAR